MPWKGNQENESQGSPREQSTLLKQMPALKVREVYQIVFPYSTHPPPWHGPCRRLNISTQKGDFLSIMFICLPCILYSSVIFKKLFPIGKDTDISGWKQQVARTHRHSCMVVKYQVSGSCCFGFKSHFFHLHIGHATNLFWTPFSCHESHSKSTVLSECWVRWKCVWNQGPSLSSLVALDESTHWNPWLFHL